MRLLLLVMLYMCSPAMAAPIPMQQLERYFQVNEIFYQKKIGSYGLTKVVPDYFYYPWADVSDSKTVGAFFEIETRDALTPTTHFAAGMRGPDLPVSGQHQVSDYGGRGVAFGYLSAFSGCEATGVMVEDFSKAETRLFNQHIPINDWRDMIALTECEPGSVALKPYRTYRIDLHVSAKNVYVGVWEKPYPTLPNYHVLVAERSCRLHSGPVRAAGDCPEASFDKQGGGFFLGAAFSADGRRYKVKNLYLARWDA